MNHSELNSERVKYYPKNLTYNHFPFPGHENIRTACQRRPFAWLLHR